MALTSTAKTELLKLMINDINLDKQSDILAAPSYNGSGNTNFIADFKIAKPNTSNETIKLIRQFENTKIVLIEYTLNTNVENAFVIFNNLNEVRYIIDTITNLTDPSPLPKIYNFKLTSAGVLYGFCDGIENPVKDKVHFFIFNDLLSLLGTLSDSDLAVETFFSAIVDVETEIKSATDSTIEGGNPAFGLIRSLDNEYGFNQDILDESIFGFVMWEKSSKKVTMVRFSTDTVNIDPKAVSYSINEEISLSQGQGFGNSDFDGVSTIDVVTGDKNGYNGSILFSTQKEAGQGQPVANGLKIKTHIDKPISGKFAYYPGTLWQFIQNTAISNDQMQQILEKAKKIYENPDNTFTSAVGQFRIISKYFTAATGDDTHNFIVDLTQDDIIKMLEAKTVEFIWTAEYNPLYDSPIGKSDLRLSLLITAPDNSKVTKVINTLSYVTEAQLVDKKYIYSFQKTNSIQGGQSLYAYTSFDFTSEIDLNYKRVQQVVQENSTAQILIEPGTDKNVYKIIQQENNSYEGTPAVPISSTKWFIPLKTKGTPDPNDATKLLYANQYNIFEFNGETTNNAQTVSRYYNDYGDADYSDVGGDSYKQELLSPQKIESVNIDGIPIDSAKYSLSGNIVTILEVKNNDQIIIKYDSLIGTPKQIPLASTTLGTDIFIAGVSDNKELGTISRAIIGAGDDSDVANGIDATNAFGFNLYTDRSSADYNQIAEETEPLDFKVKHVVGARQNNVLFITAYSEDYSKYLSWTQIYPDSDKPYTKLAFNNPAKYFSVERVSINKDGLREKTIFDNAILDAPPSGDTFIATTTAKSTDGNNPDNNTQIIYGQTNEPLFEYKKTLIKTSNEAVKLNYNIVINVLDKLEGNEIKQETASERFVKLFSDTDTTTYQGLILDKFICTYEDGSTIETNALPYLTLFSNNQIIRAEISLYNKNVGDVDDKVPSKLELKNVAGDLIATIDLTKDQCGGTFTNIGFDIVVSDDPQPFFKWGVNGWGEKPWALLTSENKGVK